MRNSNRVIVAFLFCLIAVLSPDQATAAYNDFEINNGVLLRYNGSGGDVVIPDGVTEIGNRAFAFCTEVTSVHFPEGLVKIGDYAFQGCFMTRFLNLPSSVTYVGKDAFNNLSPDTPYSVRLAIWQLEEQLWLDPSDCLKSQSAAITAASNDIVSEITDDYGKAEAISRWVASNITYDYAQYYGTKPISEFSSTDAEDVLSTKRTTCYGYAALTEALLNAQGIPAIHVVGLANGGSSWGGHAWNEAYVNNRWVLIDTTFGHAYFDMGLETFANDHILQSRPSSVVAAPVETIPERAEPERTEPIQGETPQSNNATSRLIYVYYDANGGSVDTSKKLAVTGIALGELAEPTRSGYTFDGWYSSPVGGTKITEETIVTLEFQTIYAHWSIDTLARFSDVPQDAWFYEAVQWACNAGITRGTGNDTFSPYDTVTRAQAVTFLWRAVGEPQPTGQFNPFVDIRNSDYFYSAVLWATSKGIVLGTSSDTFSPNDTCSVAHIITYLYRACGAGSDGWYRAAISWAEAAGLADESANADGFVNTPCSRAHVASLLFKACRGNLL